MIGDVIHRTRAVAFGAGGRRILGMNAIVLSIGDELVLGQTVDTNSAWLSRQLAAVGCAVAKHVTVGDDQAAIEAAIRSASRRCDFLIITGGIGPTADDLTRQALAAVMDAPLELNEVWLEKLKEFFRARGREMPELNRIQAMIPRGARMIDNCCGTAAGIHAMLPREMGQAGSRIGEAWTASNCAPYPCHVFVMPGVPKEMKAMFLADVLPHMKTRGGGAVILSRTLHTFGLGESSVAEMLGDLMRRDRNPSVGTTVSQGVVSIRINARFDNLARAITELEHTEMLCRAALGVLIYGAEDESLAQVVGRLLIDQGRTVATAESCTGGLLAKMLTDVPGSSAYFRYGWVVYANEAKQDLLRVRPETLAQYGAVSEATVTELAMNAARAGKADHTLAISGIAGPDGGTPTKPVGMVCIALASAEACAARTFNLFGDREMIRDRAAKMALTMLRYHLLGKPLPF